MSEKRKILVCGDVSGNFKTLFSRVNAINEKSGPFHFLFCVGDFFSDSLETLKPYKDGTLTVSVPTYILGPNVERHVTHFEDLSGCEICPNVTFLGRHGILSSNGLKIAYISGIEGDRESGFTFAKADAMAVRDAAFKKRGRTEFLGVDVLLSSDWPKGVAEYDRNAPSDVGCEGSEVLAWLACQLKPRYHFSGLRNVFYERAPYKNIPSADNGHFGNVHRTRFIGLAKVGSPGKNKWLYAANLTPITELKDKDLYQSTTDETECPYSGLNKCKDRENNIQYFYDLNAPEKTTPKKRRKHSNSWKSSSPKACWFCLNSSLDKHMIIGIGEEVYLALAKGGLTSYHVMIVPIKHYRSQTELPQTVADELEKYKSSLKKFFRSKDKAAVVYERSYSTFHLQLHVVPVPQEKADKLKNLFLTHANKLGIRLRELREEGKHFTLPKNTDNKPYFYLELPNNEKLYCYCNNDFPMQFASDVLASESVLNIPHRANWRDCIESKEKEEEMSSRFRKEFEKFNNSLAGE